MKKILIFLFGILLTSCIVLKEIPSSKISYEIDLQKFSDKGFLITPEKYNGEYLLISIYTLYYFPSAHIISVKSKTGSSQQIWNIDKINLTTIFEEIYETTIKKNGDAFVNFTTKEIVKSYNKIDKPVNINGIEITGYMIKRKN